MNLIKSLLVLVFCALIGQRVTAQDIDKVVISIGLKNATLKEAFEKIETLTPFRFNYRTRDIADVKGIWYQQEQVSVKKVLTDLLYSASLTFEQVQNYIVIKQLRKPLSDPITVFGFVKAEHSGETLIGATVSVTGNKSWSVVTNAYGFYSITLPAGNYLLNFSYVGFEDVEKQVDLQQTIRKNIELSVKTDSTLEAVTVTTNLKKSIVRRASTGNHRLSIADIKKNAMAGGEPDVLKSLQFLPGIQTSNEGTTNLSVRGGSYDQNLILLDEATVYNPTHTLGFFSVFNTDALKDVSIYKGVFPAQYGGRLSSVIDIRMKEGNNREHVVSGGIGLLASRLTWEGPIKKERSSFILSGRYSNPGVFLNMPLFSTLIESNARNSKVSFYDLNVKFNSYLSKKDRLYLSGYTGHDDFFLDLVDNNTRMKWGNTTVSARWNHVFNSGLFANTSLLYSKYNYAYTLLGDSRNFVWKANLQEVTLKTDVDWTINSNNQVKIGTGITFQDVSPGKVAPGNPNATSKMVTLNNRSSAQLFAYLNNEQKISNRISVSYGIRATAFAALGDAWVYSYNADKTKVTDSTFYGKGKTVKSWFVTEPRATVRVLLSNTASVKVSYGRTWQFQHLLTNSSIGLPTDLWLPADAHLKPQYSDQFATGIYKTLGNETYEASMELYYRKSYNILDFRDNAALFMNDKIETQVLTGEARAYGMEWLLKKNKGAATGWISYTWSKALRRIAGVNNNEWYPPTYDHRHNISIVYNHTLHKRWSVSANWVFRSGGRTTIPIGSYVFNGYRFLIYGKRNAYQLPAYHRLDVSVVWKEKIRENRKWQGEWVLSVYNAYVRDNVFALYIRQNPDFTTFSQVSQVYLVGILPTITYNFKF